MSGPFVLVPLTITDAMISSSTAAEPSATETEWNAGTNYTVGQECIRTSTHRVYTNLIAGIDATAPELTVTNPAPRWQDTRPTNKWAAFDGEINTKSSVVTPLTYVLCPGIFNAIALYGLSGSSITISAKTAPGGAVFFTRTEDLSLPPVDHYDYYFGRINPLTKILWRDIIPYEDPEVTITITATAGVTVGAGMIAIGDLRSLAVLEGSGGTQYGSSVKPVTYSYIEPNSFGVTKIRKRTVATDLDIRVEVAKEDADTALQTIQDVLDVPAAWIGSDVAYFSGLNTFGLASGNVVYGPNHSVISVQVKGFI